MKTYLRNKAGKFKKRYVTRNVKLASCIILGGVILFTGTSLYYSWNARVWSYGVDVAEASELKFDGLQAAKDGVLNTLAKCESGGKNPAHGIDTIDTNNKVSYGIFQFQKSTVQYYFKKMTGNDLSGKDAILLALDDVKARELAAWIIFESKAGVSKDWVNCSKWHGLQKKVDIIKSMQGV